jgi:hypothetical protein
VKALFAASIAAMVIAFACGGPQKTSTYDKHNEIALLWAGIRDMRRDAKMELDPKQSTLVQMEFKSVKDAERVCVDNHKVPTTCNEICAIADDICDNAERICTIADELGKDDDYAQRKCTDAKASCREAKQKCCGCSATPAAPEPVK